MEIKVSAFRIKFDINRWFEERWEREKEKYAALARAHCPHFEILDVVNDSGLRQGHSAPRFDGDDVRHPLLAL